MRKYLTLLILLILSGCSYPVQSLDVNQSKVKSAFQKIENKEDKEIIHILFAGSAEYIKRSNISNSANFDAILGKVQSTYGWDREKYPDFTNAVSDLLIQEGYDEPRDLTKKEDREWFSNIFEKLAEATK